MIRSKNASFAFQKVGAIDARFLYRFEKFVFEESIKKRFAHVVKQTGDECFFRVMSDALGNLPSPDGAADGVLPKIPQSENRVVIVGERAEADQSQGERRHRIDTQDWHRLTHGRYSAGLTVVRRIGDF